MVIKYEQNFPDIYFCTNWLNIFVFEKFEALSFADLTRYVRLAEETVKQLL